jgi:hypothetical protein
MPLRITVSGKEIDLSPVTQFATVNVGVENAVIVTDPDYYAASMNMTGK